MEKNQLLKLLAKKLTNEISAEELVRLDRAVAENEEYRKIDQAIQRYFNQKKSRHPKTEKLKRAWEMIARAEAENFQERFDYHRPNSFGRTPWLRIAAVLAIVFVSFFMVWKMIEGKKNSYEIVNVSAHKQFRLLADGTKIWLNRNSTLKYNQHFGEKRREIILLGEAYFDVAKNQEIPLVIHAGPIHIEVKGTAFNVNADPKNPSIAVSLVHGLVEVTNSIGSGQPILLYPNQQLTLPANGKGSFLITPINASAMQNEIRWTVDTLVFQKEKLRDLVFQLERKYQVRIEIQSEQLKEKRFSGTFTDETIQQVLEALKLSYPLTYTINNRLVVIRD